MKQTAGIWKILNLLLRILLIFTTLVFPGMMVQLSAAGWRYNAAQGHYPPVFYEYAFWMSAGGVLLIAAAVLCMLGICRKFWICNIFSPVTGSAGLLAVLLTLGKFSAYADQNFSGIGDAMQPVSELYRDRILPAVIPFLLLCILSFRQLFSYEARVWRRQRRLQRDADAPSILEDTGCK